MQSAEGRKSLGLPRAHSLGQSPPALDSTNRVTMPAPRAGHDEDTSLAVIQQRPGQRYDNQDAAPPAQIYTRDRACRRNLAPSRLPIWVGIRRAFWRTC